MDPRRICVSVSRRRQRHCGTIDNHLQPYYRDTPVCIFSQALRGKVKAQPSMGLYIESARPPNVGTYSRPAAGGLAWRACTRFRHLLKRSPVPSSPRPDRFFHPGYRCNHTDPIAHQHHARSASGGTTTWTSTQAGLRTSNPSRSTTASGTSSPMCRNGFLGRTLRRWAPSRAYKMRVCAGV